MDELFKQSASILENGEDIPAKVTNKLLAAMLVQTNEGVKANGSQIKTNTTDIHQIKNVGKWFAGGMGLIATVLGILAKLSII